MTLKSIEVSRREEEQTKLKKQQKFQMELDQIESVNENLIHLEVLLLANI